MVDFGFNTEIGIEFVMSTGILVELLEAGIQHTVLWCATLLCS